MSIRMPRAKSVIWREQVQPQPLRVAEEARVGEFAHRQVEPDLLDGNVEAGAEAVDVLRDECRLPGLAVEQRDADIASGDDLARELADDLPELHGEQGAADVAHELARVAEHPTQLLGGLLLEHAAQRVRDGMRRPARRAASRRAWWPRSSRHG